MLGYHTAFLSYREEWRGQWRRWGSRASVLPRRCRPWLNRNATSSSPGGPRPPRRSPPTGPDRLQRDANRQHEEFYCGMKRRGQEIQTFSDSAHSGFNHGNRQSQMIKVGEKKLTVIFQLCGSCDQHEGEKRCEAEPHAKQLCMTQTETEERRGRKERK